VVPYAFYINTNDLNDMFLNKAQMGWYDHLGYTLDGSETCAMPFTPMFTTHLREKVAALKDAVQAIADSVNKDIWRLKKRAQKLAGIQRLHRLLRVAAKRAAACQRRIQLQRCPRRPGRGRPSSAASPWLENIFQAPPEDFKLAGHLVRNSYNQMTYATTLTSAPAWSAWTPLKLNASLTRSCPFCSNAKKAM